MTCTVGNWSLWHLQKFTPTVDILCCDIYSTLLLTYFSYYQYVSLKQLFHILHSMSSYSQQLFLLWFHNYSYATGLSLCQSLCSSLSICLSVRLSPCLFVSLSVFSLWICVCVYNRTPLSCSLIELSNCHSPVTILQFAAAHLTSTHFNPSVLDSSSFSSCVPLLNDESHVILSCHSLQRRSYDTWCLLYIVYIRQN